MFNMKIDEYIPVPWLSKIFQTQINGSSLKSTLVTHLIIWMNQFFYAITCFGSFIQLPQPSIYQSQEPGVFLDIFLSLHFTTNSSAHVVYSTFKYFRATYHDHHCYHPGPSFHHLLSGWLQKFPGLSVPSLFSFSLFSTLQSFKIWRLNSDCFFPSCPDFFLRELGNYVLQTILSH